VLLRSCRELVDGAFQPARECFARVRAADFYTHRRVDVIVSADGGE
jgi:hypothetical protein